ncbi:MAG: hypothetical protein [Caudoviricetes sp.]|nr:MAG: hypothetical protein [Caudoviricetes sp.]
MKILLSNFGFDFTNCDDDYIPKDGEAVFDSWPSDAEMLAAFPGRPAYIALQEKLRLAVTMREKRDGLMRTVYDAGTQMVRRELETAPLDPAYEVKLINKRAELHAYARLLQAVPDQEGFPEVISWPEPPTEELE